ncbi:hypothetical protein Cgig2_022897 [Carnegiea gigantea]|uniref:non-specific serine/threonine protein kinase n=1 Tax=Carnegiea gigantea TaxID=171969 RepID=A0A9Q1KQQ9_9CARY|nr:hypothetical protein Cgig2_022897 [Carnegiea gigantea]
MLCLFILTLLLGDGSSTSPPDVEGEALHDLFTLLDDSYHKIKDWNYFEVSPCSGWSDVTCSNGYVTYLSLGGIGFSGTVSPAISRLKFLNSLELQDNNLSGVLPDFLGSLMYLETVDLSHNKFHGHIPSSWAQLSNLKHLETGIIGRGGFGKVYRGKLADNTDVAVKRLLDSQNPGGEASFLRETDLVIYYEASDESQPLRLTFLAHRLTAANILLDETLEPVLGDFGLARLVDIRLTHLTAQVRGTLGHIAPEYLTTGKCSEKTDVLGYGITLLELITGQHAIDFSGIEDEEDVLLLDHVAILCTQPAPEDRPRMPEVVKMLKGVGLAQRWGEWERLEEARNRELQLSLMTHRFAWMHESTIEVQEALQLSAPR